MPTARRKVETPLTLNFNEVRRAYEWLTGKLYPASTSGRAAARRWLWQAYGRERIVAASGRV